MRNCIYLSGFRRAGADVFLGFVSINLLLCGCSVVGPASIDQGRMRYNEVLQDTSERQTLLNIIRGSKNETPVFLDVTEVDAASTLQGSINGGPSQIGSIANLKSTSAGTIDGVIGFITGGALYSDQPTVRYQPLAGPALKAQISTRISAESLTDFFDAEWPFISTLTFGIDRAAPGYNDTYNALDAIADLDQYGAIEMAATSEPKKPPRASTVVMTAQQPSEKDNLTIYSEYSKLGKLYADRWNCELDALSLSGEDKAIPEDKIKIEAKNTAKFLWDRLEEIYPREIVQKAKGKGRYDSIVLTTTGTQEGENGSPPRAPMLTTRSANSIWRDVSEHQGDGLIWITSVPQIESLIADREKQGRKYACKDNFYTYDRDKLVGDFLKYKYKEIRQSPPGEDTELWKKTVEQALSRSALTLFSYKRSGQKAAMDDVQLQMEMKLAHNRKFMLIAKSDAPPADAFVSVNHDGAWYSILSNDEVSKRSLALITQLNTVQSIPSQNPPLQPSISVGPH